MIDLLSPFECCGAEVHAADGAPKDYLSGEPTQLFKAIETQKWDVAMTILKENPSEATKWVVVGGFGSLKRLPIHEACIHKPTEAVVTALIGANPKGVREKDSGGQLPLHHAVENGASVAVVEELLLSCPDALDVKNKWGNYPEDIANSTASEEVINAVKIRPSLYAVKAYQKVRSLEEDKMKDEFTKQLSQVSAERDEAKAKVADMEGTMEKLKWANAEIYAEKKAADKHIIEVSDKNTELEKEVDMMKTEYGKMTAKVSSLERQIETLRHVNERLVMENTEYKAKVDKMLALFQG